MHQHHKCQKSALQSAEQICAEMGARFTNHRRNVFEIIWQNHKALTAADIMEELGNKQPPITYRALEFLKEAGLIHYIASLNAYVGCMHPESHGHIGQMLICTKCRYVKELTPENAFEELIGEAEAAGFHPSQTSIEMLGVCKSCYGKHA